MSQSKVYITTSQKNKAIWVRLAQQENLTLSQWIEKRLNESVHDEVAYGALQAPEWMSGLSSRIQQCLLREGVMVPGALVERVGKGGDNYLLSIPNFGKRQISEFTHWYKERFSQADLSS